jgi:hypothetical protein
MQPRRTALYTIATNMLRLERLHELGQHQQLQGLPTEQPQPTGNTIT